MVVIDQLPVG